MQTKISDKLTLFNMRNIGKIKCYHNEIHSFCGLYSMIHIRSCLKLQAFFAVESQKWRSLAIKLDLGQDSYFSIKNLLCLNAFYTYLTEIFGCVLVHQIKSCCAQWCYHMLCARLEWCWTIFWTCSYFVRDLFLQRKSVIFEKI